jgi:hypothetical protein
LVGTQDAGPEQSVMDSWENCTWWKGDNDVRERGGRNAERCSQDKPGRLVYTVVTQNGKWRAIPGRGSAPVMIYDFSLSRRHRIDRLRNPCSDMVDTCVQTGHLTSQYPEFSATRICGRLRVRKQDGICPGTQQRQRRRKSLSSSLRMFLVIVFAVSQVCNGRFAQQL